MGDKILKSLQFPGSSDVYKIPQSDYAQTDSTQPDYIKNKLVGKEVTYSDTLTWDGNTDGLESVADMFFRISDIVPTINDLKDGAIMTFNSGTEIELVASDNGDVILLSDKNGPLVIITKVDNVIFSEIPFGSSGIYAMFADPSEYMVSLEIPNYQFPTTTTKKLTAEYLEPFEVVTKGGDTLTWDGDTSGKEFVDIGIPLYHVSDVVPTLGDLANGFTIIYNEKNSLSKSFTSENITTIMDGLLLCGADVDMILICASDNMEADGIIVPKKGIYLPAYDGSVGGVSSWTYVSSLTIPNYTGFTTTEKKLKGEYLSWDTLGVDYDNGTVLVDNKTFAIANGMATIENVFLTEGIYKIVFDGVEYNRQTNNIYGVTLGNLGLANPQFETGEPFAIADATGAIMILGADGEHTITLIQYAINKIPEFFYNRKTTLYYRDGSGDKYLYKDIGMTTKATLVDLQSAVSKGILELAYEGFIFNTCCRIEITGEYGIVTVFKGLKDGSPTYQTIYTAEYTP